MSSNQAFNAFQKSLRFNFSFNSSKDLYNKAFGRAFRGLFVISGDGRGAGAAAEREHPAAHGGGHPSEPLRRAALGLRTGAQRGCWSCLNRALTRLRTCAGSPIGARMPSTCPRRAGWSRPTWPWRACTTWGTSCGCYGARIRSRTRRRRGDVLKSLHETGDVRRF